jgi:hypothetical protein
MALLLPLLLVRATTRRRRTTRSKKQKPRYIWILTNTSVDGTCTHLVYALVQQDGAGEDDDEPPEMLTDPEAAASLGAAVLPTPTTNGKPIDVVKYIQQSHAQQIMQRTAKLTTEPKEHKFWDTQPVPKLDAEVTVHIHTCCLHNMHYSSTQCSSHCGDNAC